MPWTLYYCDHHEFPLPPGHKFPVRKYRLLRELVESSGLWRLRAAPLADGAEVALAHDAGYVNRFLSGTLEPAELRRIGFPWSEGLVRRTLASVGGTLHAAADALDAGVGGNLAGGTHHASRQAGAGFCVFNDLAVAILSLRERRRIRRAAVVDLDVHQGDGTAEIFENDPDVLTVSVHGANNFPFRKRESRMDVGLPDGAGDTEFLEALEAVLPVVLDFAPGIVLYQSGVDALAEDRLGRLSMTHAGLAERDRRVFTSCRDNRIPVAITLGGGYAEPVELTVQAHAATFRVAAEVFGLTR